MAPCVTSPSAMDPELVLRELLVDPALSGGSVSRVSIIVKNLPRRHTAKDIIKELERIVAKKDLLFVSVPWDREAMKNLGFASVTCMSADAAARVSEELAGRPWSSLPTCKMPKVQFASIQGLRGNVAHCLEAAPVGLPNKYQPIVLINGQQVDFRVVEKVARQSGVHRGQSFRQDVRTCKPFGGKLALSGATRAGQFKKQCALDAAVCESASQASTRSTVSTINEEQLVAQVEDLQFRVSQLLAQQKQHQQFLDAQARCCMKQCEFSSHRRPQMDQRQAPQQEGLVAFLQRQSRQHEAFGHAVDWMPAYGSVLGAAKWPRVRCPEQRHELLPQCIRGAAAAEAPPPPAAYFQCAPAAQQFPAERPDCIAFDQSTVAVSANNVSWGGGPSRQVAEQGGQPAHTKKPAVLEPRHSPAYLRSCAVVDGLLAQLVHTNHK